MHYEIFRSDLRGAYHYVAAKFWPSLAEFSSGRPPRIINDFKMQIRRLHQRIITGPRGGHLHISGAEVTAEERRAFLLSPEVIRWERDSKGRIVTDGEGRWIRGGGPAMAPFLLGSEAFDPQWQREAFEIPLLQSIDSNLQRYWAVADANAWEGDRRGTTLNLQVGAGEDDGSSESAGFDNTGLWMTVGSDLTGISWDSFYRFTGVTGLTGATINSANLGLWGSSADTGSPLTVVAAERASSPTAPTTEGDHAGRTRTTATEAWSPPGLNTGGFTFKAVDPVIQEIADNFSPTAILILHDDNSSTTDNYSQPETYDSNTAHAPTLDIDYTQPSAAWLAGPRRIFKRPIYQR